MDIETKRIEKGIKTMTKEKLNKTLEDHKKWLAGKGGKWADLSEADLREANLRWADLREASLRRANLRGVGLHGVDLRGADLREVDLRGVNLSRANLRGADLSWTDLSAANLTGTDLTGVNLDFSCWPLWCGSLDVKVDARIARQLAYHFCRLDCDDPEFLEAKKAITTFANKFHRAEECGKLGE